MGWARLSVRMEAMRSTQVCLEASKGRDHLSGLNCVLDGNIKMELNQNVCKGVFWIQLARASALLRAVKVTTLGLWDSSKAGSFLSSRAAFSV